MDYEEMGLINPITHLILNVVDPMPEAGILTTNTIVYQI